MMLLHRILLIFIFIISTALLFSYNAYAVYTKDRALTLNSSNTSYYVSSSVKPHITTETCVYNTQNRLTIRSIGTPRPNTEQFYTLHFFVLNAIKHPVNCKLTHHLDDVISIFTAASTCKDDNSIIKLASQLSRQHVSTADEIWNSQNILDMSSAISKCSGPNISYIRQIIAHNIVKSNNDMSEWESYNITTALRSLNNGNSDQEAKAFKHIVDYVVTKNCNIDKWGDHQLSKLFKTLSKTNTESAKIAMLKVLGVMTKSGLSNWDAKSTSTVFRALARLQKTHSAYIKNERIYEIVMQLIINRLASSEINFRDCDAHTLADTMGQLWHISKLRWPKNVDKARQNIAKLIVEEDINISTIVSNDWVMIICGLTDSSIIEIEAMRTMATHFNDRTVSLSQWTNKQLLNIATSFSQMHGHSVEKSIQKTAIFVATENLEFWDIGDLAILAEVLSPKTKDLHHKAIDNIAGQILKKSIQLPIIDYIDLAFTVSLCKGEHCLELVRYISTEVADDSFDVSHLSPIFLAKLISIVSTDDEKYAEKALTKITNYLIYQNTEQLLNLPSDSLKLITHACSKHYNLTAVPSLLRHISFIVLNDRIDLSDWPIETLEVLLRTINSHDDDDLIQKSFRKIIARLNCPDTELRKWSINTLALVAKGVSRVRDYSSELFIARLAKMYIEKRDYDESKCGITILLAICNLPILSRKIIKPAVKLASILYNKAYSNMDDVDKISLFWTITLLDFVAHEKWMANASRITKTIITELTKIIPEMDQETINKHTIFFTEWQLEFINIMNSYREHESSNISLSECGNKSTSVLKDSIHRLIEIAISGLSIELNCSIYNFPIDFLLSSESISLLVNVDGPHNFFKDGHNRYYRLAKDRFVDFIFEKQLGYKVMRINDQKKHGCKFRRQFIQQIIAAFPNSTIY
ncbi:MAG: hypothetical protein QS748_06380 [Candidatus Endonucleobacter bathymodioli]|uniref:RAP domain-containing protein n=1 Tax=Candidatus Endonucleibacter bathymodioli TaxID=539814 RepID=A0AA90SMG8_9GAMM|nr:hypothetical protein [Candidatus Endonucleobacter bathymodioli]